MNNAGAGGDPYRWATTAIPAELGRQKQGVTVERGHAKLTGYDNSGCVEGRDETMARPKAVQPGIHAVETLSQYVYESIHLVVLAVEAAPLETSAGVLGRSGCPLQGVGSL